MVGIHLRLCQQRKAKAQAEHNYALNPPMHQVQLQKEITSLPPSPCSRNVPFPTVMS
jgi:hypothetical protein